MTKEHYTNEKLRLSELLQEIDTSIASEKKDSEKQLQLKSERVELIKQLSEIRERYMEANSPCKVNDEVEIVDFYNRTLRGKAKSFSILEDGNVYVTEYKVGSTTKYLSRPYKSIKIL